MATQKNKKKTKPSGTRAPARSKTKTRARTPARPKAKTKAKAKTSAKAKAGPKAKTGSKRPARPGLKPKAKTAPKKTPRPGSARKPAGKGRGQATAPGRAGDEAAGRGGKPKRGPEGRAAAVTKTASAGAGPPLRKPSRKSRRSSSRRLDTRTYPPGEVLLPAGPQDPDEVFYLLRGCVAAEEPSGEAGVNEIRAKGALSGLGDEVLGRAVQEMARRFDEGPIEPRLPERSQGARHTFASVVDRARHRRREIGAFLRGLDLGGTETSHMDPHGEASLQSVMEWAARLEVLTEADEPRQADYAQFHKVLDQLEINTEALILDVEQTLRRLRDRVR